MLEVFVGMTMFFRCVIVPVSMSSLAVIMTMRMLVPFWNSSREAVLKLSNWLSCHLLLWAVVDRDRWR